MPDVEWGSRGAEKVFRDNENITKSVKSTGDAYKDTMREAQELGRVASKIAKENESAYDRYAKGVVNAKRALDGEKISTEQLGKEVTRLTVEYLRQTDSVTRLTTAQRAQIEARRQHQDKLNTEYQTLPKLRSLQQDLAREYTLTGAELGNLAQKQAKAFDPSHIAKFLPQALVLGKIFSGISKGVQDTNAATRAAADRSVTSSGPVGELAQVSSNAEHQQALRAQAKQLVRRGIAADEGAGAGIIFDMASADIPLSEQEDIYKLAEKGYISKENLPGAVAAAGRIRKGYGGTAEANIDVAAQTAKATFASLARTMTAATTFTDAAQRQGISREDAFAAFVPLETRAEGPGEGATQLAAFYDAAQQKGIKGKTTKELVENTNALIKKHGGNAFEVLGRKEAVVAHSTLNRNMGEYLAQWELNKTADARNFASEQANINLQDPNLGASQARIREEGATSIGDQDNFSTRENLGRAVQAGRMRTARKMGWLPGVMESIGQNMVHPFMSWDSIIGGEANATNWGGEGNVLPETRRQINEYMQSVQPQDMNAVAAQLKENTAELKKQTQIMERDQRTAPTPSGGPRE